MTGLIEEPVDIAVVDYGMGNRRSVEKALEHVGARASVSSDPAQLRAPPAWSCRAWARFRGRWSNLRELGLDELLRERVAAGTPVLGICLGMQLAFDYSTEQGGSARAWASSRARCTRCSQDALKLPHIGWNEVRFSNEQSPLIEDLPLQCAFYHVHSFAPVPARAAGRAGHGRVRRAVRERRRTGVVLRRAVPPGEVLRGRPAPAGQLRAHLRHGSSAGRAGEALSGDRHTRRQRRAPGQGRLRRQEGL